MYFMSDPQALHVTRNVIPGKLGVDLHLHTVHIPLVLNIMSFWQWHFFMFIYQSAVLFPHVAHFRLIHSNTRVCPVSTTEVSLSLYDLWPFWSKMWCRLHVWWEIFTPNLKLLRPSILNSWDQTDGRQLWERWSASAEPLPNRKNLNCWLLNHTLTTSCNRDNNMAFAQQLQLE